MRISGGIAAALCAAATLSAREATANGRYPASTQIVFSTDAADPDLIVVRATYGLLVSRDNGATWRWLCESALGVPSVSVEDPSVALTANDGLVVGLERGTRGVARRIRRRAARPGLQLRLAPADRSPGSRSSISPCGPDAPDTCLALSSTYVFSDAATATLDNRVWQTPDDGAHWSQRARRSIPTVTVTTIDVAASDPTRLYVSGTRGFGVSRTASLFVSTDGGETLDREALALRSGDRGQRLHRRRRPAVADRVYVRSSGSRGSSSRATRAVVSGPAHADGQMLGFAIAPDGTEVYAGSVEDGLLVGRARRRREGSRFTRVSLHPRGVPRDARKRALGVLRRVEWLLGGRLDERRRRVRVEVAARRPREPPRLRAERAGPVRVRSHGQRVAVRRRSIRGRVRDARRLRGATGRGFRATAGEAPRLTPDGSRHGSRCRPSPACGCTTAPRGGSTEASAVCVLAAIVAMPKETQKRLTQRAPKRSPRATPRAGRYDAPRAQRSSFHRPPQLLSSCSPSRPPPTVASRRRTSWCSRRPTPTSSSCERRTASCRRTTTERRGATSAKRARAAVGRRPGSLDRPDRE